MATVNKENASRIIKVWNYVRKERIRTSNDRNIKYAMRVLEADDNAIREYSDSGTWRDYISNDGNSVYDFQYACYNFAKQAKLKKEQEQEQESENQEQETESTAETETQEQEQKYQEVESSTESTEEETEAVETQTATATATAVREGTQRNASVSNESLGLLEKAIANVVIETQGKSIADAVIGSLNERVDQYIANNYGPIERKLIVTTPEKKVEMKGVLHSEVETITNFVAQSEPVFLVGPAGSGKNVICQQVAQILGLDFYFSSAVSQEYKITGYTDAYGKYQESEFYKAFTKGGLFMLDEMDASIPEVLVILNSAIANRYFDFPAPIGRVDAHENFRVISAGNTFGLGADMQYVGRNQIDMATLDRFAMVYIDYDERIEFAQAQGDEVLVNFIHDFRNAVQKCGINTIVSYRAVGRIKKMSQMIDLKKTLRTCLLKNLQNDDINNIASRLNDTDNVYAKAMLRA